MTDFTDEQLHRAWNAAYDAWNDLTLDEPSSDQRAVNALRAVLEAHENEQIARLEEALRGMCHQFAYDGDGAEGPTLWTGGLSALEETFDVLGWTDPHPIPESKCARDGCLKRATCGTPTPDGYKRLCFDHYQAAQAKEQP